MGVRQIVAILLIVLGLACLVLGGFSWTREKTVVDIGPLKATTQERKTLPVPPVIGGLLLAGGVGLLLVKSRR